MNASIVDASVAVKWFFPEPGRETAAALLQPNALIVVPDLIIPEVGNVVWKKVRRGDADESYARTVISLLPKFFNEVVQSTELSEAAMRIALELRHPVYDAFYLALAELRGLPLVTADRRLADRAAGTPWASLVRPLA